MHGAQPRINRKPPQPQGAFLARPPAQDELPKNPGDKGNVPSLRVDDSSSGSLGHSFGGHQPTKDPPRPRVPAPTEGGTVPLIPAQPTLPPRFGSDPHAPVSGSHADDQPVQEMVARKKPGRARGVAKKLKPQKADAEEAAFVGSPVSKEKGPWMVSPDKKFVAVPREALERFKVHAEQARAELAFIENEVEQSLRTKEVLKEDIHTLGVQIAEAQHKVEEQETDVELKRKEVEAVKREADALRRLLAGRSELLDAMQVTKRRMEHQLRTTMMAVPGRVSAQDRGEEHQRRVADVGVSKGAKGGSKGAQGPPRLG